MTAPTADRRTGRAAVVGGLLLAASVGAELVHPVQAPDGTVTNLPVFAVYLVAWLVGATALLGALLGLGRGPSAEPLARTGRIGRGIAVAGTVLLVTFGAVGLGTAVVAARPAEWSFLLFAVGMLLLFVAAVPLALGLRRGGRPAPAWIAVLVSGLGIALALGVEADPWHDLGLFVCFGAWVVLGVGVLRGRRTDRARVPARVG